MSLRRKGGIPSSAIEPVTHPNASLPCRPCGFVVKWPGDIVDLAIIVGERSRKIQWLHHAPKVRVIIASAQASNTNSKSSAATTLLAFPPLAEECSLEREVVLQPLYVVSMRPRIP